MHKKLIVIMLCVALGMFLFATSASAIAPGYTGETTATAGNGINMSVHDLRRANNRVGYKSAAPDTLDRLCVFCHAPHHTYKLTTAGAIGTGPTAPANATYLPLWNHTITTMVFVPYKNGPDEPILGAKRSQAIDTFDKIGATSLLCLSCHDGSISVNEYGHAPQNPASQSSGGITIAAQYNIGKGGYLANHHPIGFPYDVVAGLDPEIFQSNMPCLTRIMTARPISSRFRIYCLAARWSARPAMRSITRATQEKNFSMSATKTAISVSPATIRVARLQQ